MAEVVERALREKHHLIVEAGTGVGKSFAYLVPAILAVTAEQGLEMKPGDEEPGPKKRIIISTHTISLQEQLIRKDLPFLQSVMPGDFRPVLVKGRGNYLSVRRLRSHCQHRAGGSTNDPLGGTA